MNHPAYFWLLVLVGAFFASVAIVAGFWMFAPIVIVGVLLLLLVRTHRSRTDQF